MLELQLRPGIDLFVKRERFVDLNIEGASVVGEHLRLLQRGTSSQSGNALIDLKLAPFLLAAMRGKSVGAEVLAKVQDVDLGTVPGSQGPVRWTFTGPGSSS